MIKNVLTHIGGIGIYGVISICLFFTVFTGALLRALLVRQSVVDHLSALPLDDGTPGSHQEGDSRHE
jgi:hypothetical protein